MITSKTMFERQADGDGQSGLEENIGRQKNGRRSGVAGGR